METHAEIIVRLGGIRKVAAALGHASHTTVQGWHDRKRIPVERWADLIQLAAKLGEPLSPTDLMPSDLREATEAPTSEQAAAA